MTSKRIRPEPGDILLTIKQKLAQLPHGVSALFFIQIFSTLGYSILYSTLVLYATKKLGFSDKDANEITAVFGAFNYGLHLFGGYLGGRFLSNRNLFVGGMLLQVLGCASIAMGTVASLYWGLGLFLTGSGLNVTCINLMLTQRFQPEDNRREGAFLWNYAGMNLGFFIGFLAAGHYEKLGDYSSLFIFGTIGNFMAVVLTLLNWKSVRDLNTPLLDKPAGQFRLRFIVGLAILVGLVPVVHFLLQQAELSATIVFFISGLITAIIISLAAVHKDKRERNNMWAYVVLTLGSLVFWTLYQMAPLGLQIFIDRNVDRVVWGFEIAPQWVQNINSFVIMIGGPIMAMLFERLRKRGWKVDVPIQFSISLVLIGLGFLVLPLGISLAGPDGMVAFKWVFINYVLQSLGELLISPVGYAMIGRLAPRQYQGIMMGTWMLVSGTAFLLSGKFSSLIPDAKEGLSPAASNPIYSGIFSELGWASVVVGVVLFLLIPVLRKLIRDAANAPALEERQAEPGGPQILAAGES
jgi:POT family proton-dependent oligopeptide transporter